MLESSNFLDADTSILDTKLRIVHVSIAARTTQIHAKRPKNSEEIFHSNKKKATKFLDSN